MVLIHTFIDCGERNIICQEGDGEAYLGNVATTLAGSSAKTCRSWKGSKYWHWYQKYWDETNNQPDNLCRNPEGSGHSVWCYTDDNHKDWAYCSSVRRCSSCDTDGRSFICVILMVGPLLV